MQRSEKVDIQGRKKKLISILIKINPERRIKKKCNQQTGIQEESSQTL